MATSLEKARKAYSKNQNTKYSYDKSGNRTEKKKKKKEKKTVSSNYEQVRKKTETTGKQGEKNRKNASVKKAVGSVKKSYESNVKKAQSSVQSGKKTTSGAHWGNVSNTAQSSKIDTASKGTIGGITNTVKKTLNPRDVSEKGKDGKYKVTDFTKAQGGTAKGKYADAYNRGKTAQSQLEKAGQKTVTVDSKKEKKDNAVNIYKANTKAEQSLHGQIYDTQAKEVGKSYDEAVKTYGREAVEAQYGSKENYINNTLGSRDDYVAKKLDEGKQQRIDDAKAQAEKESKYTYSKAPVSTDQMMKQYNASLFQNNQVKTKTDKDRYVTDKDGNIKYDIKIDKDTGEISIQPKKKKGKEKVNTTAGANIIDYYGGGFNDKGELVNQDASTKLANQRAGWIHDAPVAAGAMQGLSYSDITRGLGNYSRAAAKDVNKTKESGAFNAGYMGGLMGQFFLGGTQGMTDALVSGVSKKGIERSALNIGVRKAGASALVEAPINTLDAIKMATDADGNFDKKAFITYMGLNTGLSGAMGGVIGGAGSKMLKKDVKTYADLIGKARGGKELTADELNKLSKLESKFKSASEGSDRAKADIVDKGKAETLLSKDEAKEYVSLMTKRDSKNLTKAERNKLSVYDKTVKQNYIETEAKHADVLAKAAGGEKQTIRDMEEAESFFARSGNPEKAAEAKAIVVGAKKQMQADLIQKLNPKDNSLADHTWIESADDIKTFDEAIGGEDVPYTPDYTPEMAQEALEKGEITVYSSHPIKDGAFVTPSKMEAENYAGGGKIYEQTLKTDDVAWIDGVEGQVAKTESLEQPKTFEEVFDSDTIVREDAKDYLEKTHKEVYENDKEALNMAAEASTELRAVGSKISTQGGNMASDSRVLGDSFSRDLIQEGHVELRGRKARNLNEVAEVMQVYRDPRFETFRIVYVKNDTIVATEGISARMTGFAPTTKKGAPDARQFYEMKNRMERLNADGYYLVHNHPSGKMQASHDDKMRTRAFNRHVSGFKGHVVLDHDTYLEIDARGVEKLHKRAGEIGPDALKTASVENPLLGTTIRNANDVTNILKTLEDDNLSTTFIFRDSDGKVTGIESVSNSIAYNKKEIGGFIKNRARHYGGRDVFIGTKDPKVTTIAEDLIKDGYLTDCVHYGDNVYSLRKRGINPKSDSIVFGKETAKYKGRQVGEIGRYDDMMYAAENGKPIKATTIEEEVKRHLEDSQIKKGDGVKEEIETGLRELAELYRKGDTEELLKKADELARKTKTVDEDMDLGTFSGTDESKVSSEIKQHIFNTPISVRGQTGTINHILENVGYDEDTVGAKIKLRKNGGKSIDAMYQDLQEIAPERFPDTLSEEDQLKAIIDAAMESSHEVDSSWGRELTEEEIEEQWRWHRDDYIASAKLAVDSEKKIAEKEATKKSNFYSVPPKSKEAYEKADKSLTGVDGNESSYVKEIDVPDGLIDEYKAYINSVNEDFKHDILSIRNGTSVKKESLLSEVTQSEIDAINDIVGFDITGYRHTFDSSHIVHNDIEHGIKGKRNKTMTNANDLARIEYVMQNADTITEDGTSDLFNNAVVVKYRKRLNGEAVVVEAVPESSSKKLRILSAYFDTGNETWGEMERAAKKGISEKTDANPAPARTSDNGSQYPPKGNVQQNTKVVNNNPNAKRYSDQLHRDAKVSSTPVSEMRYDDLKKEADRLKRGIDGGKTREHIALRKERLKEVEEEIKRKEARMNERKGEAPEETGVKATQTYKTFMDSKYPSKPLKEKTNKLIEYGGDVEERLDEWNSLGKEIAANRAKANNSHTPENIAKYEAEIEKAETRQTVIAESIYRDLAEARKKAYKEGKWSAKDFDAVSTKEVQTAVENIGGVDTLAKDVKSAANKRIGGSTKKAQKFVDEEIKDYKTCLDNYLNGSVAKERDVQSARATALLDNISERLKTNPDDADAISDLMKVVDKMSEDNTLPSNVRSSAKTLAIATPKGRLGVAQKAVDDLNKRYGDRIEGKLELTDEERVKLAASEGDELEELFDSITQRLWDEIPATRIEKINEIRHMFMLTNVRTHARNMFGNVTFRGVRRAADDLEILLQDKVFRNAIEKRGGEVDRVKVSGKEIRQNKKFLNDEFHAIYDSSDSVNKYIETSRPDGVPIVKQKQLNWFIQGDYKALEWEDMITFKPAFRKSYMQYVKSKGWDIHSLSEAQKKMARERALFDAEYATFRDTSAFSRWVTGKKHELATKEGKTIWGTALYRTGNIALEGVLPFVKTPVNIFRRSVDFSPISLIRCMGELSSKDPEVFKQGIKHLSTGLTGTGIFGLGFYLSNAGFISIDTRLGDHSGSKYYDQDMGYQDYSLVINIGDYHKSWSIDWLQPVESSLFMGAAFRDMYDDMKTGDLNLGKDAISALFGVTSPMLDASFMSSAKDMMETFEQRAMRETDEGEPDMAGAFVQMLLGDMPKNYISSAIPQLVSQTANVTDKYQRDTRSTLEDPLAASWQSAGRQIINRIPVLRQKFLNPKLDRWGDDKKTGNNVATRILNAMFNPSNVKEINENKYDRELFKIRNHLEKGSKDYKNFFYNFTGNPNYELANGKRMNYKDAYTYGKANRIEQTKIVQTMVDSPNYKEMTWGMKASEVDSAHWIGNMVADHDTYGINYALGAMKKSALQSDNSKNSRDGRDYKTYQKYVETAGKSRDKERFWQWRIEKEEMYARAHPSGDDTYRIKGLCAIETGDQNLIDAMKLEGSKEPELKHYWKLVQDGSKNKTEAKKIAFNEITDACCRVTSNLKNAKVDKDDLGTLSLSAGMSAKNGNKIDERVYRALGHTWNSAQAGGGLQLKYNKDGKYDLANLEALSERMNKKIDERADGQTQKDAVCDFIENDLGITNADEAACVYQVLYIKGNKTWKNPYKSEIDDHLEWKENNDEEWGVENKGGSGRGRRGHRRGGWGHGGGGSSGSGGAMPKTESGAFDGKVTNPFSTSNGSKASNLDEAYRKKAKKLRESSRKKIS